MSDAQPAVDPLRCSECDRSPEPAEPTWAWSRERLDDRLLILCPACTRDHSRSIEAKLDRDWW
ncbi:hypothetical protein [Microlunatus speluncae]|uniref:hypothetical protein n=1 Tax=Microlunatus speluncae TaxID=2594267 RepID=UPI001266596D|nr:hypothetical protein [Microlunatus speluncae]